MSNQQPGSLFDGKTILLIFIGFGAMLLWQSHLKSKYPDAYKPAAAQSSPATTTSNNKSATTTADTTNAPTVMKSGDPASTATQDSTTESIVTYEDDNFKVDISSAGMSLKNVQLKKYNSRKNEPILFAHEQQTSLFGTSFIGRRSSPNFQIEKKAENEFVGRAEVDGVKVTKIMQFDPKNYSISTTVNVENANDSFLGLATAIEDEVKHDTGGFSLVPQFDHQEFYILHDGKNTHERVNPKKDLTENYPATKVIAFGDQYFAAAIIDKSEVIPDVKVEVAANEMRGKSLLTYPIIRNKNELSIKYIAYVGPKSFDVLSSIDEELTRVINFGWFTSIGKIMKLLMTSINGAVQNWGVSIILLTILIRILVFPVNMMSYKQMKAMQTIQPQMAILRERYKGDPQKMNQEVMKLWKEAKANPLGGCLPMLLQIPIFFALYSVIGQSIELYKAPFMLWWTDLSAPDHFFVLPILMGGVMFFQQKMTPSTMDPAQQKIMMFMPIIFSVMMVSLPCGLTLYMFVSALFGFLQQMYFLKGNKTKAVTA